MPRPTREFPVPKLRAVNGHFKLRWYADGTPYQISLGAITKGKAQAICTASGAAFAGRAEFPDEIRDEPALKRYLLTKHNITANTDDESLIAHYIGHMRANSDSDWPMSVKGHLKRALEFMGTLHQADTHNLQTYLDHIASSRSNATRNRCAAALGGFYKWMRKTGQHPRHHNPMAEIKPVREDRPPDGIVIWEENEIKPLLEAANKRRDGIAVWIAIFAGLRRSEIARLKWVDVAPAYIIVQKTKTGPKTASTFIKCAGRSPDKRVPQTESCCPLAGKGKRVEGGGEENDRNVSAPPSHQTSQNQSGKVRLECVSAHLR